MSTAKSCFEKSAQDLRMAQGLFSMDTNFKEGSVFMCQQSIEKALKGFLVSHKIRVAKTHDLVELSKQAFKLNSDLKTLDQDMERFTEYAISYRYPDAASAVLIANDVEHALSRAQEIYNELWKASGL